MTYAISEEGLTAGIAIDLYTTSSSINERGYYDNEYSALGSLIHEIKYEAKTNSQKESIINEKLFPEIKSVLDEVGYFDDERTIVCPMPPTEERDYQPVYQLAKQIASYKHRVYYERLIIKNSNIRAKNLADGEEFEEGSFKAFRLRFDADVVIVDDTYGKGRSLRACIKELRKNPNVKNIFFISIVKNRRGGLVS